ncbi:hypothetical protein QBC37DRAFT_435126 [Rhypophila decipiens]|uniref:Uncharacterized protein n=1 Tax=Rhypophila decipiens TaxID=261697 RepID=A0AAN6XXF7_9PEZI|nr:hypothetical protein QBC37DRAFT_435126 [Rhypophila decipiens]
MVMYGYLLVYHERRSVPAHWAFFVTDEENGQSGRVYHAVGSPFTGYQVEVKPSYSLANTRRRYSIIFLGQIADSWRDQLSGYANNVAAPGISPSPLDPFAGQNCQNWLEAFIQKLVSEGILDSSALDTLSEAPKV